MPGGSSRADAAIERRIVTISFADIVGFTRLSTAFDPEDVATIQSAYFGAVRDTLERYGGMVEKFIGDAAMAVFGLPRARDDDTERAVRAGLALVAAVEHVGARLGLDEGTLQLRVGINTGEVVVGAGNDGGALVTGDTVNVAARLQTAAEPGGVLVGETTALAVGDAVELEPLQTLALKGKDEPVRAARALGVLPERSREHAMGLLRAPLLGRERQLARLAAAVATGGRLLVVAPPGVGKSRLVSEFAGSATWTARLRPDIPAPYEPVAQLVRAALAQNDLVVLRARQREAGAGEARVEAVAAAIAGLLHPRPDGAMLASNRSALFDAWLEGLAALGSADALWLVEDVHWAGGDVLAFLDEAARRGAARLVLATARPSILESAPEWCRETQFAAVLHLPTLAPTDAAGLVSALVGDVLPAGLVGQIAHRSDGNPLFIEELLRLWISVGTLMRADGGWRLAAHASDLTLPATVQALYAAQLDDLPAPARQIARRASVAGRRFPLDALPALAIEDLSAGVDALTRRSLIAGPMTDPLFGSTYAYRHALLRDAGYASLARAERARLHVRLAQWAAQTAGERWPEVAELVGRHYADAVESAPALSGELDQGLSREQARRLAAEWLERAGVEAMRLSAHEAAAAALRRAVDLTAPDDLLDLSRRLRLLGEAITAAGDLDEATEVLGRAYELAEAELHGPRRQAARPEASAAAFSLGVALLEELRFADAAELAKRALTAIGDGDDVATGWLLSLRDNAQLSLTNDTHDPQGDRRRATAIARRAGDAALELYASQGLIGYHLPVPTVLAGAALDELVAMATDLGRWSLAAGAIEAKAMLALLEGDLDGARSLCDRSEELARARGAVETVGWLDYTRLEIELHSGRWDEAVAWGVRALDLADRNSYHRLAVRTWMALSPIAAARGDEALLARLRDWYLPRVRRFPDSPFSLMATGALGLRLADAGLIAPPHLEVEPRIASWAGELRQPSWFAGAESLFSAWLVAGELQAARRGLTIYAEKLEHWSNPLARSVLRLLDGRLAAATADDPRPLARLALTEADEARAPWWRAKALRLLGEDDAAVEIELRLGIPA
jgi:class 3 adenylate cyclase/tetratricopeptide (TPR) repeat protein